ncbi:small acid-soluble spore protein N [Thalassobacillus sp. CUG 92003]|nr:small acid-soluble spore protein N [Thalassobacillus sp. CUG 92003]
MGNPKRHPEGFQPKFPGSQSRNVHTNKGRKMAVRTDEKPIIIQTKGK